MWLRWWYLKGFRENANYKLNLFSYPLENTRLRNYKGTLYGITRVFVVIMVFKGSQPLNKIYWLAQITGLISYYILELISKD